MRNCGFIGLGQMGAPMAAHVLKGQPLTVVAIEKAQQERFRQLGATVATETAGVAACDLVFLCLPNGKIVEQVIFGAGGLASVLRSGAIIVDTSTIEYQRTLDIAERLKASGISFLDAPVSGMQARAEAGTLTVMCGGPTALFDELQPYFASFANKILHMGDVGAGQLAKLINQLLFDINAAALAEILPLAVKLGLDPDKTGEIINSGTGRSYASEFFVPNILKGDFSKGYPMAAAYKDLISGAEISARQGIPTPVLAAATAVYQSALLAGDGDKDKGGMICHIEKRLGVTFRSNQEGSAA
jgi:3-hydroxyisobutyrate dehydrogenase-like beta-hydroxyacid dehydrogenase